MKQCIRCDRKYPDTENFCEMDGAYLISLDDLNNERPVDLCMACDGLSPGIDMDGETIVHCAWCGDSGKMTPEQARQWEQEAKARYAGRKGFSGMNHDSRQLPLFPRPTLPSRPHYVPGGVHSEFSQDGLCFECAHPEG